MQTVLTMVRCVCDKCGLERQFTSDQVPAYWVHVPEGDLDFCPDCMNTIYEAAISNKDWYARKFGPTLMTTYSENQYLSLKKEYEDLKSKYDELKEKYDDKMKAASFGV